jgi:hypothetical protein
MSHHDDTSRRPESDSRVDSAWKKASAEQPPARLDAEILAAARKSSVQRDESAGRRPLQTTPRNWLAKWQPLAAAAAVAGLAFLLVPMLPRNHPMAPSMPQTSAPATAPAPAESAAQAPQAPHAPVGDAASDDTRAIVLESETARERSSVADGAPRNTAAPLAAPAPPPATAPVPPPSMAGATTAEKATAPTEPAQSNAAPTRETAATLDAGSADRRKLSEPASGRSGTAAAAAPAPAPSPARQESAAAAAHDATAWADTVAALHDAGDLAAAADALREFRASYPDADTHLPRALRDWARTVK